MDLIQDLEARMMGILDNYQLERLHEVLVQTIVNYEEEKEKDYLGLFVAAKRVEGCSENTIRYYQST